MMSKWRGGEDYKHEITNENHYVSLFNWSRSTQLGVFNFIALKFKLGSDFCFLILLLFFFFLNMYTK